MRSPPESRPPLQFRQARQRVRVAAMGRRQHQKCKHGVRWCFGAIFVWNEIHGAGSSLRRQARPDFLQDRCTLLRAEVLEEIRRMMRSNPPPQSTSNAFPGTTLYRSATPASRALAKASSRTLAQSTAVTAASGNACASSMPRSRARPPRPALSPAGAEMGRGLGLPWADDGARCYPVTKGRQRRLERAAGTMHPLGKPASFLIPQT